MSKVVIFGILDLAELAHWYLENDSEHEVVAFTVHQSFIKNKFFKGLPVVPFEKLSDLYPKDKFKLFAPMTAKKMNKIRENIFLEGKSKGYDFITYISTKATVCGNKIGENCFILEDNTIQPFTTIGNNVVLWSGNHIGHHGKIEDHVFFTSHVVMSGHCHIKSHSFFGVNSTLRDNLVIDQGTLVAMGSSIIKNTEKWGVYVGNPAKKLENKVSHEIY
jgi:sugar O-acyltransferase (sialic acid O-acetyltransferase NeuD family)